MPSDLFSTEARKAIEFARDEAARLRHDWISTEHLLLGLIKQNESRVIDALDDNGIDINELRQSIEEVVQPSGGTMTMESLPITARARKALEIAGQEQRVLKSGEIEPEHIFLALLKDEEGVAAQVLSMYDYHYSDAYKFLTGIPDPEPKGEKVEFPISSAVITVIQKAREEAVRLGSSYIGGTHFVLGLIQLQDDPVTEIIRNSKVDLDDLRASLEDLVLVDQNHNFTVDLKNQKVHLFIPQEKPDPKFSRACTEIMVDSYRTAKGSGLKEIDAISLLTAILENTKRKVARLLDRNGLSLQFAGRQIARKEN